MAQINGYEIILKDRELVDDEKHFSGEIIDADIIKDGVIVCNAKRLNQKGGKSEIRIDFLEKDYSREMYETAVSFEEALPNLALGKNNAYNGVKKLFMFLYDITSIEKAFKDKEFDYFYIYKHNENSLLLRGTMKNKKNETKQELQNFLVSKGFEFNEASLTGIENFDF